EEGREREGLHGFARSYSGWMGWWSRDWSRRRGCWSRRRARRRGDLAARGTVAGPRATRRQRWREERVRGGERAGHRPRGGGPCGERQGRGPGRAQAPGVGRALIDRDRDGTRPIATAFDRPESVDGRSGA